MRFFPALVAFALATAVVANAHPLAEFLVQVHDPNLLGGPLFDALLHSLGYAFVFSLCGVLCAGTVLLVAWRTRRRGAPDIYATLAAVLAGLCLAARLGVSLDPIGWIGAAAFALMLERPGRKARATSWAILAGWSLLQGGATLGALLAVIAAAGAFADARRFDAGVREKALLAAGAVIIGGFQLRALPWHAYGAHALYLDAFAAGAQRDHLWNGNFSLPALSFGAIVVIAAWYGVRRRGRSADAIAFFALMLLCLADSRNLPYFGIVAAPLVADAAASFYLDVRSVATGSIRQYFAAFAACAFAFVAVLTVTEPKVVFWPRGAEQPAALLAALSQDRAPHRVLCEEPRWCDGVQGTFSNIAPLLDDRAGTANANDRRTQDDAVKTSRGWRSEIARARVDAIVARSDSNIVALLTSTGWQESHAEGTRVLLRPARSQ